MIAWSCFLNLKSNSGEPYRANSLLEHFYGFVGSQQIFLFTIYIHTRNSCIIDNVPPTLKANIFSLTSIFWHVFFTHPLTDKNIDCNRSILYVSVYRITYHHQSGITDSAAESRMNAINVSNEKPQRQQKKSTSGSLSFENYILIDFYKRMEHKFKMINLSLLIKGIVFWTIILRVHT